MNKKLLYILLALVMVCSVALTACNLTPAKVTITYKYNYEGAPADKTVTLDEGATITLDTPTRTDYKFDGWFTDAACTKAFTDKVANANVTLYAKWTASHTHDLHYQSSSSKHWQECSCGYTTEQVDHTFDANNTCVCGYKQGGTAHTHSWATDWSKDATNHWHVCTGCSELNDKAAHDTNGTDGACSVCGYKAQAQGQAVTVYFYTADWTTVNAYAWTDTPSFVEHLGGWPGTAINAVAGEEGWYSVEVPADTQKIIFNDGSKQTKDLLITDGPYFVGSNGYATKAEAEEALSKPAVTTYTLRGGFDNWGAGLAFEAHEEGQVKLLGVELEAGVQFKVYITNGQTEEWISALEEGVTVAINVTDESGNENITVSETGIYDLYFKIEAKQLYIAKVVEEHEHVTEGTYVYDDNGHWVVCTCGEKVLEAAHVPGAEATETEPQICTVCKKILAPALGHEHVTEGEYVYDENNHWVICDCEEKVLVGEHDFAKGDCVCGAKAPAAEGKAYLMGLAAHAEGLEMTKETSAYGDQYTVLKFEVAADDIIYVQIGENKYGFSAVEANENIIVSASDPDQYIVLAPGTYNVYFKTNTSTMWIEEVKVVADLKAYIMGVAGDWDAGIEMTKEIDDNQVEQFVYRGLIIGETDIIKVKTTEAWYGFEAVEKNEDISVEASGAENNIKLAPGTYNIYFKTGTSTMWIEKVETPHEHVTEGEYVSDENGHWVVCTCGEKVLEAAHVPGAEATETEPQICTVCEKVLVPALGHEHVTEGEYVYDENNHWVVCDCEEKVLVGEHDTEGEEGACSVCGYKEAVKLADYRLLGINGDWTVGIDLVENPDHENGKNEYMLLGVKISAAETFKIYVGAESFTGEDRYIGILKDGVTVAVNTDESNKNSDIKVLADAYYDLYFDATTNQLWIQKAPCKEHTAGEEYSFNSTVHYLSCTVCSAAIEESKYEHDTLGENGVCSVCGFDPSQVVEATVLYLTPNANWKKDGARFAAYFFGNGEVWVDMTDEDGDGIYEVVVPEGFVNIIFCRMNPSTTENNWENNVKWNQTADLKVPTDGTNMYTVAEDTWDKGGGTWSTLAE